MSYFDAISSEQITILSTLIGTLLSKDLNTDEQNALGNVLINIGQALVTIASLDVTDRTTKTQQQNTLINEQIDKMNMQISLLKERINQ